MDHKRIAYALARITLGVNFFVHGLVRMPKLAEFREGIVNSFEGSLLPKLLVTPFVAVLPFLELTIGLLLLLGLFTRETLIALAVLMMLLMFGSGMKEDWGTLGTEMVYALFVFFLLFYWENNTWALDDWRRGKV